MTSISRTSAETGASGILTIDLGVLGRNCRQLEELAAPAVTGAESGAIPVLNSLDQAERWIAAALHGGRQVPPPRRAS
jgi:hypothetical protein